VSLQHPRELILVGAPAERLSVATDWGATAALDLSEYPDAGGRIDAVRELTNGDGADVVFECSGVPAALGEGLSMAAAGARIVVAGIVGAAAPPVPAHLITVRGLSVKGSFGGDIDAYWKGLEFLRLHRDRFDVGRLLGNSYRLDEVTTALERMRSMEEIKPVIRPSAG
jgi:threonine dehydrogenase-like Zn-dependent dehydrogenase